MKPLLLLFFASLITVQINSQSIDLPRQMTEEERSVWPQYLDELLSSRQTGQLPDQPVRVMGEWEEIQALFITWRSFPDILSEVVKHAIEEVKVYIITQNEGQVAAFLTARDISLDNVEFLNWPSNSVWIRDYGPWAVYENDVEQLAISDYIYNRPRPSDNMVPQRVADEFNVAWYAAVQEPFDLIHTGGNNLVDGYKTGYSSRIVSRENPLKSDEEIDFIAGSLFGYENYIKFDELPFDGISHLDMHMRFIDEETVIVGEYPEGVADGPTIEQNIEYLLNNHTTSFGKPYEIIRIPMPPGANGNYPDNGGPYRTFTNSIFLNGTILVPIYEEQYDTVGLRIYRESLPGYNVVGIDCNAMINSFGALHCITKTVGVEDPLWIAHPRVRDLYNESISPEVRALAKHRDGIDHAHLFYRPSTDSSYLQLTMEAMPGEEDWFFAELPAMEFGTEVHYYIEALSLSGKVQTRPIVAPEGYFKYEVIEPTSAPVAAFSSNLESVCPGGELRFLDRSAGGIVNREWQFPGGNPAVSTEVNPLVAYSSPGVYDVVLIVENQIGADTLLMEHYVHVEGGAEPYLEDFSTGLPDSWENFDNGSNEFLWEHFEGTNCTNNMAVRFDNYNSDSRGVIATFSNTFDLSELEEPELIFRLAYAPFNADFFDGLEVVVHTCDGNRNIVFREFGTDLATAGPTGENIFIPGDCSQWRDLAIDISEFGGQSVNVAFRNIGGWGNMLYLDNILIREGSAPNMPPVVRFVTPAADTLIREELPFFLFIEVQAEDFDGFVAGVNLKLNGENLADLESEPYQYELLIEEFGEYAIEAVSIDNDGGESQPAVVVVVSENTGTSVEEISNQSVWSMYPNPATDQVIISTELARACEKVSILVKDITGKTILEREVSGVSSTRIDISSWPSGSYHLSADYCGASFDEILIITR